MVGRVRLRLERVLHCPNEADLKYSASDTEGIKTFGREHVSSMMNCKKGHVRCPMATSKPFVVSSLSTKRYAPSTREVSPVVPNAGPRRPQPSRIAPSKPFVVCSLSTKRHAPSKRASIISSSPPTQSSPPTVIAPLPNSAEATAGLHGTPVISSPTNGTCAEASYIGPRRPQPSRFAPSKPFVVCSLSTKRHAPSKRASTITSSSPTQSSPPTVIAPSPNSAEATAGLDGTPVINSPTNGTCAEASYTTGVLTVVSPEDVTTSSMAMLATIIEPVLERRRKWRAVSWLIVVCTLVLLALLAPTILSPTIDLGHLMPPSLNRCSCRRSNVPSQHPHLSNPFLQPLPTSTPSHHLVQDSRIPLISPERSQATHQLSHYSDNFVALCTRRIITQI
ncbi:hypothetical protein L210DRAFT_3047529 [Boletus edulis BED1]|uniref:Uncharacterized protein n=1 Tax=Boletus edulis BED1 TaxID=1328754 RepID=A0AAD4GHW9_BOLED|nr:hypothetical protein L210DRAFT_3047529 [Boletus edulis BED1]